MHILLADSEPEWEKWRSQWNQLAISNPMQGLDWLQAWWRAYGTGHRLNILLVLTDQRLVGFVPLYQHRSRFGMQLRFLGSGAVSSDYLSAVADPANATEILEAITGSISQARRDGIWHNLTSLRLEGMVPSDPWLGYLERFAREHDFSLRTQTMVGSWSMALPRTWADFIASQRGRSIQRKAKKCASRILSGELSIRYLEQPGELEYGLQTLIRLHQARRQSLGDDGCFADERFTQFLRNALAGMFANGNARFCLCESDCRVIAIQLQLLSPSTIFMYQTGADPEQMKLEPGHSVVTGAIMRAIEEGYKVYDFLRGDEPYKSQWGAQAVQLQRLILAPPSIKAQAIEAVNRNLAWMKHWSQQTLSPIFAKGN